MCNLFPHQILAFANDHADAMRMVSERSAFHLPTGTSPRALLARYVETCDKIGARPFNDHWYQLALEVVEELGAKRAESLRKLLRA